jgi:hypothetical protein
VAKYQAKCGLILDGDNDRAKTAMVAMWSDKELNYSDGTFNKIEPHQNCDLTCLFKKRHSVMTVLREIDGVRQFVPVKIKRCRFVRLEEAQ